MKLSIPIFPLNGVIFFPNTNLPLNIFEKKYIDMVDFALTNNKIIGMIQTDVNKNLYKIGCMGRISALEKTNDGRYIINLEGRNYFHFIKELPSNNKFRIAKIETKEDLEKNDMNFDRKKFNKKLLLNKYISFINQTNPEISYKFVNNIQSKILIKFIAMSCPFSTNDKQMLLETFNLNELSEKLITLFDFYQHIEGHGESIN